MPSLGYFSAWIMCDGRPLPEYCVSITKTSIVSCWIPSEAGKNFSVHWGDSGSHLHSCAFISLDGLVVPGRFLCGRGVTSRDGVRTGDDTERPFVFAQQVNPSSGSQNNPDAGKIVLKVRLITIEGQRAPSALQQLPEPSGLQGSALSHCATLGKQKLTHQRYPTTWSVKSDGSGNKSHVTFVFHYRPREHLVSHGITPLECAVQMPSAIRRVGTMNRRVASSPLPAGCSSMATRSANPTPLANSRSDQIKPVPPTAVDSQRTITRPTTSTRVVSESHNHRYLHPEDDFLSLGIDPSLWRT